MGEVILCGKWAIQVIGGEGMIGMPLTQAHKGVESSVLSHLDANHVVHERRLADASGTFDKGKSPCFARLVQGTSTLIAEPRWLPASMATPRTQMNRAKVIVSELLHLSPLLGSVKTGNLQNAYRSEHAPVGVD
jgi:hypothetical protein